MSGDYLTPVEYQFLFKCQRVYTQVSFPFVDHEDAVVKQTDLQAQKTVDYRSIYVLHHIHRMILLPWFDSSNSKVSSDNVWISTFNIRVRVMAKYCGRRR